jgi:hypothetical protein
MSNWMLERTAQRLEAQRNAAEADVVALRAKVAELELALSVNPNSRWNAERDALKARVAQLEEALRHIEEGSGPFNRDQLTFASNCIDNMKARARAALATKEGA